MKKLCTIILLVVSVSAMSLAQDTIFQKNKIKLNCKIQREDSTAVYISIYKNDNRVNTFINKNAIDSIKYGKRTVSVSKQIENDTNFQYDRITVGIGLGTEFGGLGGNIYFFPQKNIGLFLGLGTAIAGMGVNSGIKMRLVAEKHKSRFIPFIIGMYGYNAAIYISGTHQFNKLFYGTSLGIGFDYESKPHSKHYWTFSLLVPQRSSAVDDYINDLTTNHNVIMKNELWPITFTIGDRFTIY